MRTSFSHSNLGLLALILAVGVLSTISVAQQPPINPLSQFDPTLLPNLDDFKKLTNSSGCVSFLKDVYENPENHLEPFMATGKSLNDFGDSFACRRLANYSYYLLMITSQQFSARFILGLCIPSACSPKDFKEQEASLKSLIGSVAQADLSEFNFIVQDPQVEEDKVELDIVGWITLMIMGTIVFLGAMGSYYDLSGGKRSSPREAQKIKRVTAPTTVEFSDMSNFSSKKISLDSSVDTDVDSVEETKSSPLEEKLPMGQVLLNEQPAQPEKPRLNFVNLCKCFSFYTNGSKLFATNKITDDNASTECLNGFRVCTMLWVVLGHTYYYHLRAPILNLNEYLPFIQELRNQPFVACPLSVDSFLFMGGFLGSYLMLKEVRKRKGRINFIQVWIHRIYRIVPLYLLIVLFGWKIMPQFVVGVAGYTFQELMNTDCSDTWWSNILFLNNFFPVGKEAWCFGHSWYLAVDMQCFLPLPILLITYYKNRKLGWIIAFTLFFGSIFGWFAATLYHGWSPDLPWIMANMVEYFEFYTKPYYRFAPYGLGIMLGFLISEYKDETLGHNIFAKRLYRFWRRRIWRYLTYVAGTGIILWSIFIHYPVNNGDAAHWSPFLKSLFMASQRSIWVFGWALLFAPAFMGWGSVLRGIFGATFWSPLMRLAFGAYLVHPTLIIWYYWQLEQPWFIGNLNSMVNAVGFAAASFVMSTIFSLMAESPAANLEKFLMPQKKSREAPKGQTA